MKEKAKAKVGDRVRLKLQGWGDHWYGKVVKVTKKRVGAIVYHVYLKTMGWTLELRSKEIVVENL